MPYIIQDILLHLPTEPFLYQDKTFGALSEIVTELGGTTTVDTAAGSATATIGPWTARIRAGFALATVEGMGHTVTVPIDEAPYLQGDAMFVPLDVFRDLFGYEVTIDAGTVTIVNPSAT